MRRQIQEAHNLGQSGRRPCFSLGMTAVSSRLPRSRRSLSPIGYFDLCVVCVRGGRVETGVLEVGRLSLLGPAIGCRAGVGR